MFALQNIIRKAPQLAKVPCRTIVSTPPRVRVSFIEKVILGAIFYAGTCAVPAYIIVNMRNYSKAE